MPLLRSRDSCENFLTEKSTVHAFYTTSPERTVAWFPVTTGRPAFLSPQPVTYLPFPPAVNLSFSLHSQVLIPDSVSREFLKLCRWFQYEVRAKDHGLWDSGITSCIVDTEFRKHPIQIFSLAQTLTAGPLTHSPTTCYALQLLTTCSLIPIFSRRFLVCKLPNGWHRNGS